MRKTKKTTVRRDECEFWLSRDSKTPSIFLTTKKPEAEEVKIGVLYIGMKFHPLPDYFKELFDVGRSKIPDGCHAKVSCKFEVICYDGKTDEVLTFEEIERKTNLF